MMQKSRETLVQEYKEAKAALEAGPEPGAERKKRLHILLRNTGIVLLVLAVVLLAAGTIIWNVEALRISVVNFFIEMNEANHTPPIVSIPDGDPSPSDQPTSPEDPAAGTLLEGLIPQGFSCVYNKAFPSGSQTLSFMNNSTGARISLGVSPYNTQIVLDTENAQTETHHLSGYQATTIEKITTLGNLSVSVLIFVPDAGIIYSLTCLDLAKDQVLEIASVLAERSKDLPALENNPTEPPSRPTKPSVQHEDPAAGTLLEGLIPENYILDSFNRFDDGTWLVLFRHTYSESTLLIQAVLDSPEISFDREYKDVERFLFNGYYGYFGKTDNVNCSAQIAMFFHDPDNGLCYKINSDGLSSYIIWDLTDALTERLRNGYTPTGG